MDKVHFVSLFAVDFDLDIMPFFSEHYLDFGFDDYAIFLNSQEGNIDAIKKATAFFGERGFETAIIEGDFADGNLRQRAISAYVSTLPANDFIVVSDSDELQSVPFAYREMILTNDIITGTLVDRWDTTLHDAIIGIPLKKQYPLAGYIDTIISAKGTVAPGQVVKCHREKIMASRCIMPVNWIGSHGLDADMTNIRVRTGYDIWHYSFRASYIKRMQNKSYYNQDYQQAIKRMFNVQEGSENA